MSRSRLILLGLDGLPLDLARTLSAHLPNVARIVETATTIDAELPELSPVNWTSLYTGEGPETHGIHGFTLLDPRSYELRMVNAEDVACPTIFDRLGEAGLVSRVVNLPNTWPVPPSYGKAMKGMMVAGFVAQDRERAFHPPFLASRLNDYQLEADTTRGASDPDYLLAQCAATLDSRRTALDLLWPDLAWDLFVFVLTETDRLFHFLYPAVADPAHARHIDCLALLVKWDALIGRVLELYDALPEPKRLAITADHGFTELAIEVDLNAWLRRQGYLQLQGAPENEWDASIIAPAAQAFALDPGRIYLHRADRFARGTLSPAQAEALLPELRDGLLALEYQGEPVMEEVLTARELYGPNPVGQYPDLICVARPGLDLKAKYDRTEIFGLHGRFGAHTRYGGMFADSQGERPDRLRDVGRLILEHFQAT